jgi:putative endonuclease
MDTGFRRYDGSMCVHPSASFHSVTPVKTGVHALPLSTARLLRFPPDRKEARLMAARHRAPVVYILASRKHGTLYVGVTSDLPARLWHHTHDVVESFTSRYSVHLLVYYEAHETMYAAITREKQIKDWRRAWKIELIERRNPDWRDLSVEAGV